MRQKFVKILVINLIFVSALGSCKKGWLDAKPDQKLVVPATLADLQALLDNGNATNNITPGITDLGTDDYYITSSYFQGRPVDVRNIYSWADGDVYQGASQNDWNTVYKSIYYTNVVLETIDKIAVTPENETNWKNIKGAALFLRAFDYFNIAQAYVKPYISATANSDPGVVMRLSSDINKPSVRASIQETYDQIIADLKQAKDLLTSVVQVYKTRPNKTAALAMLARTYLSMENYDSSFIYADASLQANSALLNFNNAADTSASVNNPIAKYNVEVLFHSIGATSLLLPFNSGNGYVDSTLYTSYDINDKRRTIFFKLLTGRLAFIGTYSGSVANLFSGLATDEMYLIRAECYARKGNTSAAMQDLNALMIKRWKTSAWIPFAAMDANDALKKILAERRKELCFRGIRWADLRRLNKDPQFAITIRHGLLGTNTIYSLPPNDIKYVWPIPDNEILYSGVSQNPR